MSKHIKLDDKLSIVNCRISEINIGILYKFLST